MPESDLLLTIAEISIAFAGFASIVGVLGRRTSRDDPRLDGIRMQAMVVYSLLVVVFALLPVLGATWSSSPSVWRLASAGLGAAGLATGVHIGRAALALKEAGVPTRGPVVGFLALGIPLLTGGALVVNAVAPWTAAIRPIYLTGLVLYLFVAGLAFGLIILSFLGGTGGDVP